MFRFLRSGEIKDLEDIRNFLARWLQDFETQKANMSPELFRVTRFIIQENIEIYSSIITLRKKGHFLSCLILARSVLENSVNLQYIYLEDIEQRAKNFDLFALKGYVARAGKIERASNEEAELLRKMDVELKDYKPSGNRLNYWDGKNISDIFSELNIKSMYTMVYKRLSGFTHSAYNSRDFNKDRPVMNFYRGLLVKEIYIMVLESIRVVSERFDLEDSISIIRDYPQQGAVTIFSTNPKKSEAKESNYSGH